MWLFIAWSLFITIKWFYHVYFLLQSDYCQTKLTYYIKLAYLTDDGVGMKTDDGEADDEGEGDEGDNEMGDEEDDEGDEDEGEADEYNNNMVKTEL